MYPTNTREAALDLLGSGRSLNSVSQQLGISRSALREWREHGIQPRRPSSCFVGEGTRPPDPEAYAGLFGYYLGDGCISRTRSSFVLRVSCDANLPGIITDVTRLLERVHVGGSVCHVKGPGVIVVQNGWSHWPCVFPQHGPGRKHERRLTLDPWQRAIMERHPAHFLRGLFHSDGCRVTNWASHTVAGRTKRYHYPRWHFTNHSPEIMRWCQEALDLLDISWRQSSWKTLSVSRKAAVARLDELIGLKS